MTLEKKLDIFKGILALGDIWGKSDQVEMLDRIWNLHLLSSEDPRYKDAYGDAVQHLRNNSDWDDEYTFLTRFGLLKDSDAVFIKFLNEVVSTNARKSKDEILRYVDSINGLLKEVQLNYVYSGEENGLPVYEISEKPASEDRPIDIRRNDLHIYVDCEPRIIPCLALSSNNWDDYSRKTTFKLFYVTEKFKSWEEIGEVKIMNARELDSRKVIPRDFLELTDDYCSLGQDTSYYKNIKAIFPNTYMSIMYALRDAGYFSTIADRFQQTLSFQKSLIRYDVAQQSLRNAHSILEGIDLERRYNFVLKAKVPYHEGNINIGFCFGDLDDKDNLDRVKALIGENGSGKSSIMYSLAKALHDGDSNRFEDDHRPDFSKVIAISYSIFDNLFHLTQKSSFNFVYCGLRNRDNELISEKDKKLRLKLSLDEIVLKERTEDYFYTLSEVIDEKLLKEFKLKDGKIETTRFIQFIDIMSSGQAMITSIITELYAHIRWNSLILFDEPEVHLHANAITKLIRILFDICREFKSACLLATHSAVILQELLARNVTVVEKLADTNEPYVRPMNTETLGENLTVITEDVFGRAGIDKHYGFVIRNMVRAGLSSDKIEQILKTDGLPMSLNLYMYIRNQIKV